MIRLRNPKWKVSLALIQKAARGSVKGAIKGIYI